MQHRLPFLNVLRVALLGLLLSCSHLAFAQPSDLDKMLKAQKRMAGDSIPWRFGGFGALNVNQTALSNWAAGGQNALAITTLVNFYARYRHKDVAWDMSLDAGYGLLKQGPAPVRKNEDKVELNSKFDRHAFGKFYYAGLLNFRTQFSPGYDYTKDKRLISDAFAPAYLLMAVGLDYRPNDYFSVFISPAAGKFTFVMNQTLADRGEFGVAPAVYDTAGFRLKKGENLRSEFGALITSRFQKDIAKNVNLLARTTLFDNYTNKIANKRANIDVNFDALVTMKVSKYLSSSVFVNIIYDDDVDIPQFEEQNGQQVQIGAGPRTQLKEVLGLGLSYKLDK